MYKAFCKLTVGIMFLLSACAPVLHPLPPSDELSEHVIIFIPGFKGTALGRVDSGETPWVTAAEALFGSRTLARDESALGIANAEALAPLGVLDSIPVLPWLYSYPAYGACLSTLTESLGDKASILPFPYDWRQDNLASIERLHQLVVELRSRKVQRIDLVGHSMGAMLAAYYLRYGTQQPEAARETWAGAKLIDRVVTVGAPFRGTMVIFRDMQRGTVQGLNDTLLDAEALSSFTSSYQLLPHPDDVSLLSPALTPLPNLLFDARRWNQFGWGLLGKHGKAINAEQHEARYKFTSATLQKGEAFLRSLNAPPKAVPEFHRPLLNIIGEGTPTLSAGILTNNEGQAALSTTELRQLLPGLSPNVILADGDGIITLRSAKLPAALRRMYQSQELRTSETHAYLCSEGDAAKALVAFLRQ